MIGAPLLRRLTRPCSPLFQSLGASLAAVGAYLGAIGAYGGLSGWRGLL